jgi:hypothetical protein
MVDKSDWEKLIESNPELGEAYQDRLEELKRKMVVVS